MNVLVSSSVLNEAAIHGQNESSSAPVLSKGERRALRVGKIKEVSLIVKMAPSTILAKRRLGEFPPSMRLSYKQALWDLDKVEAWFQEKLKAAPVYAAHVHPKSNGFAVAEVANA